MERQNEQVKIVLIDSHSILNRLLRAAGSGRMPRAFIQILIYGFLTIMFKLLEEEKPEYLTVAFDVPRPDFRTQDVCRNIKEQESRWLD